MLVPLPSLFIIPYDPVFSLSREVCDRDEGPQETRRSLIHVRGKSRSIRRVRCCRSTSALLFSSEVKQTVNVAVSDRPWGVAGAKALAAH